MIYFIQAGGHRGCFKVGTAADAKARCAELQVGNSQHLCLVKTFDGDRKVERKIHAHLKALNQHVRGEWYRPSPELRALMAEGVARFVVPDKPAPRKRQQAKRGRWYLDADGWLCGMCGYRPEILNRMRCPVCRWRAT